MTESRYHQVRVGHLQDTYEGWAGLSRVLRQLPSWMGVDLTRFRVIDTETRDLSAVYDPDVPLHYTGVVDLHTGEYAIYDGLPPYDESAIYVVHNAPFDIPVLRLRGFPIRPDQVFDTQVMAYEWDSTQDGYSLDAQAGALGQPKLDIRQRLIDDGFLPADALPGREYWHKTEQLAEYLVQDLLSTCVVLAHYLELYSSDEQGWYYLNSLAMPYLEVVMEMQSGLFIDTSKLDEVQAQLEELETQRKAAVESLLPDEVEVWRKRKGEAVLVTEKAAIKDAHIAVVLQQDSVELPVSKTGRPKMDKDTLGDISHPLVSALLEYREVSKLTSTFVSGIRSATNTAGVLRPHYCLTCTATGRLSSSSPNVQNISARSELGSIIRGVFAAPPGYVMAVADLDRIEAVLLGWWLQEMEDDEALARVFREGIDLHQTNADNWGISRFLAKTALYLLMYGGGAQRLSIATKIPLAEAKLVFDSIAKGQPSIDRLKASLVSAARTNGGLVHDPLGRRYIINGLDSPDWSTRSKAERRVFSYLNQGFAGSIFKELQIRVWLYRHQLGWQDETKQVLAVHDEGGYLVSERLAEVWDVVMSSVFTTGDILTSQDYETIPVSGEFNHAHTWKEAK